MDDGEALKALLEAGADPNARNDDGNAPLHFVKSVGCLKLLLDHGADPRLLDYSGLSAFHRIAQDVRRDPEGKMLAFYLDHLPPDVLVKKDIWGRDLLFRAVLTSNTKTLGSLQKMIDLGCPVNEGKDGEKLLHRAVYMGNDAIVKLLLQNGADVKKQADTLWPRVIESGSAEIARRLINAGIATDVRVQYTEQSVIFLALHENKKDIVSALLDGGVDPNQSNSYGWTALHHMKLYQLDEFMPLLLKHGANVNAQDNNGLTPLHRLLKTINADRLGPIEKDQEKVIVKAVRRFIDAGADVQLKDDQGQRPYEYALRYSLSSVVELLDTAGNKPVVMKRKARHEPRP